MLIGLHGRAGSGKDQTYKFIQDWADFEALPCRRDAFADRLKLSAARIFFPDITLAGALEWADQIKALDECGDPTYFIEVLGAEGFDLHSITGREFLQRYGTEAHRQVFGTDFWIKAVMDTYLMTEILVVTDIRFENEAVAIRDAGGDVWLIERPGQEIKESAHASEQPLPDHLITHTIDNSGSLEHLRDLVQSQMERLVYADHCS